MQSRILASSTGWNWKLADPDPQAGAVDVLAEVGHEGEQQEDDAEDEQRIAVAVEVP